MTDRLTDEQLKAGGDLFRVATYDSRAAPRLVSWFGNNGERLIEQAREANRLERELARAIAIVDTVIAHLDGARLYDSPSLEEIHSALVEHGFIDRVGKRL